MTGRIFPDFSDAMEWNLVARETLIAPTTPTPWQNRIPARSYLIQNSHVTIIGVRSTSARSRWFTGGWASQILPFTPSSTSEYTAAVRHESRWLRLNNQTLVIWPRILPTWLLTLDFPYWLEEVRLEVWRYDGADLDVFNRIDSLEQNLN